MGFAVVRCKLNKQAVSGLLSAMVNIDKLPLWGKILKVTPSKHTIVQMPREGQPVSYSMLSWHWHLKASLNETLCNVMYRNVIT